MKNRIKEIMKSHGVSREQLAEKLDAHPTTISRLINGQRKLDIEWIEKFADALNVAPSEILEERIPVRVIQVQGYVQAGEWAETWHWEEDQYEVAVPDDPQMRNFSLYGAETRGPSMNKRYPEGTILVFTDTIETKEQIEFGKRYIVERERADGLREATVKLLWKDEHGKPWLLPESDDPRFQEPIAINGNDGDTIRIVGRVRYAVSRE